MSQDNLFKDFDVKTVSLSSSNLIEASAGTGKTFSIAILILRLLLENKIAIQEILMVTFTKAAVAELEERIRNFVREAYRCAQGKEIEDQTISAIVHSAIEKNGVEEVNRLLKSAILNLDETSVMTIHGFCQQTLNEFAFETSQLFSAELVSDTSEIMVEEIQKFWRKYITGIQTGLLTLLSDAGLNQGSIKQILDGHLSGKTYIFYEAGQQYTFDTEKQNEIFKYIKEAKIEIQNIENELNDYVTNNYDELIERGKRNKQAQRYLIPNVTDQDSFYELVISKKGSGYIIDNYAEILDFAQNIDSKKEEITKRVNEALNTLFSFAIQQIVPEIENHKTAYNLLSFDDMISNLHKALDNGKNQRLIEKLQQKFKAVFIDEFQDTDREQYEIFDTAFGQNSIVFYIGDPKQSIYGWRKADIATYLRARGKVENRYSMNINYRSDEKLVKALNQFFSIDDVFYFRNAKAEERFDYIKVDATKQKNEGLSFKGKPVAPMSYIPGKTNSNITDDLCQRLLDLLTNPKWTINGRKIKPSDIGILVRENSKGNEIKNILAKVGIPAVTVTEAKILESEEAADLILLLEAIIKPNRSTINAALLTKFIAYHSKMLLNLDSEKAVQQFRSYLNEWKVNGIYTSLMKLMTDFNIRHRLIENHTENGERTLTNLYQLTELLHKTENRKKLNPVELTDWLKINVQKNSTADDEFLQRIENDEDAVKIVTIHKSKGLEYNIVFAPTLNFRFDQKKDKTYGFRNKVGNYVSAKLNQLTEEQKEELIAQEEQENRRLLYVTLTRAKNKCFVYKNIGKLNVSTLKTFSDQLVFNELIQQEEPLELEPDLRYIPEKPENQSLLKANDFESKLKGNNWSRISYSGLAAEGEYIFRDAFETSEDDYDQFIFKSLRKGAKTGNFLHHIFENIDFSKPESWEAVVQKSIKRFMPGQSDEFENYTRQLLSHVFDAKINTPKGDFSLNAVPAWKCLHELEFDFPVKLFRTRQLEILKKEGISIGNRYGFEVEGIMNGKIDLFFEHQSKYYILDWKSNYLGSSVSDYAAEKVNEAMTENNYHLQYLIYSFAVKKYLESRLGSTFDYQRDFGGVIYLFVRGMRAGQNTGIFYAKPSLNQIGQISRLMEKEGTSV